VTGTHIRGEVPVGSALIVYYAHGIEQSGSATLDQFAPKYDGEFSSVDTISNQSRTYDLWPTGSSNGINTFQGASFICTDLDPQRRSHCSTVNAWRRSLDGSFTDLSQIP